MGGNTMAQWALHPALSMVLAWVDPSATGLSLVRLESRSGYYAVASLRHCTESTARCNDACYIMCGKRQAGLSASCLLCFSLWLEDMRVNFFPWPLWKDVACVWRGFSGRGPTTGVGSPCILAPTGWGWPDGHHPIGLMRLRTVCIPSALRLSF